MESNTLVSAITRNPIVSSFNSSGLQLFSRSMPLLNPSVQTDRFFFLLLNSLSCSFLSNEFRWTIQSVSPSSCARQTTSIVRCQTRLSDERSSTAQVLTCICCSKIPYEEMRISLSVSTFCYSRLKSPTAVIVRVTAPFPSRFLCLCPAFLAPQSPSGLC